MQGSWTSDRIQKQKRTDGAARELGQHATDHQPSSKIPWLRFENELDDAHGYPTCAVRVISPMRPDW
jgi:hypothetical protein